MREKDYQKLKEKALSPDATQDDLRKFHEWFLLYSKPGELVMDDELIEYWDNDEEFKLYIDEEFNPATGEWEFRGYRIVKR